MANLHSLQHNSDDQNWFKLCLDSVKNADGLILLEDAVSISCHLPSLKKLNLLDKAITVYVLDVDLEARGLTTQFNELTSENPSLKFERINYQEFVDLTLQYDKLVNWA